MELLLSSLILLACPVGMGLMMWLMMRGMQQPTPGAQSGAASLTPAQNTELLRLRVELEELRAEQRGEAVR